MELLIATKNGIPIIGQIGSVLGWIMDGIFKVLNSMFGIENIGLCIIIFTILMYLLMTPLQIKQQKFSKLSAVMQPEITKIQKKYQGKIWRFTDRKLCAVSYPVSNIDGVMAGNL